MGVPGGGASIFLYITVNVRVFIAVYECYPTPILSRDRAVGYPWALYLSVRHLLQPLLGPVNARGPG